jgi:2-amino-4-hydroxy-6-hydroxymethyldihydropteridine diphosphokinase/dihydropteroate synthase
MLRASELGIDMINDVGGLTDSDIAKLCRDSKIDFVLMHSLSVPPTQDRVLPQNVSPLISLRTWFSLRFQELEAMGLPIDRVVIDPGIGFGKTPLQSLEILANIKELQTLNARLLVGASRKSFLHTLTSDCTEFRDAMSNGISHFLANQGVDILRLHNPLEFHSERLTLQQMRALHACTFHQN